MEAMTKNDSSLDTAIALITKQFGKGSIMSGTSDTLPDVEFWSSGSISLDKALGGGYAKGRVIEIMGPPSAGKTTLTLHAIAEVQRAGGRCAFIDVEHALDPTYAAALGVNMEDLLVSQPDSAEEALGIAKILTENNAVSLIVIDSVAALTPKAELEGEIGDSRMGLQARLMSQAMRMLTGMVSKTSTTIIFLNQIRMKIGVMFGSPETTAGGEALKFYASQRLDIRIIGKEKDNEEITGTSVRVKVIKNKVAPAYREAEFSLEFGVGINRFNDLLLFAEKHDVINKAGSWYSYQGNKIGQGSDTVTKWLLDNPDKYTEIFNKCKAL